MIRAIRAALLLSCCVSFAFSSGSPWLDVPYVSQSESGCGAASIAMVMQYWVRQKPELDAGAADSQYIYNLLPHSKDGISGEALKGYLEKHGFTAFVFSGETQDLRHHLENGRPLVVGIAPRGLHRPLHYVVVVGITGNAVLFHDPVRGKLTHRTAAEFQREWEITNSWTLLAIPRREP